MNLSSHARLLSRPVHIRMRPIPTILGLAFGLFLRPLAGQQLDPARLAIEPLFGRQVQHLSWTVGSSRRPVSELTYDHVQATVLGISLTAPLLRLRGGTVMAQVALIRGTIDGGRIRDSDYSADGAVESRRSMSSATGTTTEAHGFALGWRRPLHWTFAHGSIVYWVGWTRNAVDIRMQDGVQVLPLRLPLSGLDSKFAARRTGPWIGVEPTATLGPGHLRARLDIRVRDSYRAEGTWNLRKDLAQPRSFDQHAHAAGFYASAGYVVQLGTHAAVLLSAAHAWWDASGGSDVSYHADGTFDRLQIVEATWTSSSFSLGVRLSH
jgi:hypothetical protein